MDARSRAVRAPRVVGRRLLRLLRGDRSLRVGRYRPRKDLRPLTSDEAATIDAFHSLYYDAWDVGRATGRGTIDLSWFGYRTLKSPLDLWTYQEIIVETRPDLIIECGTRYGGSAYYLASILDLLGHGRVLTIDLEADARRPAHPRITYLLGSSTDPEIVARVHTIAAGKRCMVILDSDHSQPHVAGELAAYGPIVASGCYMIVEDTNVNGHPVRPEHGPGPMEALDDYLAQTTDFEVDRDRERFLLTMNPRGFLRRVT